MTENIAIVGAGGFGREVAVLIHNINAKEKKYTITGFYDDRPEEKGRRHGRYEVMGRVSSLNEVTERLGVVIAIGNPGMKRNIFNKLNNGNLHFPPLIHPLAWLGDPENIRIEEGVIIAANAAITTNVVLEKFSMINLNTTIGHDVKIGAFTSVMPGANISGNVTLGSGVLIGAGATVINEKTIGDSARIGAGATVISDIPANVTAVGVPAKIK